VELIKPFSFCSGFFIFINRREENERAIVTATRLAATRPKLKTKTKVRGNHKIYNKHTKTKGQAINTITAD